MIHVPAQKESAQDFNPKLKGTAKLGWQSKPHEAPEPLGLDFQLSEVVVPRSGNARISDFVQGFSSSKKLSQQPNRLIWGDNLLVMQALLSQGYRGSIDLIYIDPPFNTGEVFNFNTEVPVGSEKYEKDLNMVERLAYVDWWERGVDSFLDMMYPRLQLMHSLLSNRGSIYLHCDENAGHYLKIIMDEIFGRENLRNEIIWRRMSGHGNVQKRYGQIHDTILFYVKSDDATWNNPKVVHDPAYIEKFFTHVEPGTGRRYRLQNLTNPAKNRPNLTYEWKGVTKVWKYTKERMAQLDREGKIQYTASGYPALRQYLDKMDEGAPAQDLWTDIQALQHAGAERIGFPTQKPEALLERIIQASSNEGDLIADFFCGSGTAAIVAERMRRKWIAVDYSKSAIHMTRNRLIGKDAEPFVIQNLGNYQRHLLYAQGLDLKSTYRVVLSLYGAAPREDLIDVGTGENGNLVYVSPPDRHLSARAVFDVARKLENLDGGSYSTLVVLAWDYELQYDEHKEQLENSPEFHTKLKIVPRTIPGEIYRRLKDSPVEELSSLSGRIRFYDKPMLKISKPKLVSNIGDEALIRLQIERYNLLDIPLEEEKKTKFLELVKNNFALLIDYYAVDWNYDGQLFRSQQQEFAGFGRDRKVVNTIVETKLRRGKKYRILVRLVDIFGNDAEAQTEIDLV